jgi:hypothetical protein
LLLLAALLIAGTARGQDQRGWLGVETENLSKLEAGARQGRPHGHRISGRGRGA